MQYINVALKNGCAECGKVLESVRGRCQYFFTINKFVPVRFVRITFASFVQISLYYRMDASVQLNWRWSFLGCHFHVFLPVREILNTVRNASHRHLLVKVIVPKPQGEKEKKRMLRVSVSCSLYVLIEL